MTMHNVQVLPSSFDGARARSSDFSPRARRTSTIHSPHCVSNAWRMPGNKTSVPVVPVVDVVVVVVVVGVVVVVIAPAAAVVVVAGSGNSEDCGAGTVTHWKQDMRRLPGGRTLRRTFALTRKTTVGVYAAVYVYAGEGSRTPADDDDDDGDGTNVFSPK